MNQSLKVAQSLPGNFGLPFFGKTVQLFNERQLYYQKQFQKYGPTFKFQILGKKVACLVGPEANQLVLKEEADKFSSKIGWAFLEPLLGEGILLQDGQKHHFNRKLMHPAFHRNAVASYFDLTKTTVEDFLKNWEQRSPILLIKELRELTLLITCRLLLGTDNNQEDVKMLSQYFLTFVEGIRTIIRLDIPLTKFGRARTARCQLETFLGSVINQWRIKHNFNQFHNHDVLSLLLMATDEQGNGLSDSEIITQIIQLLFGAYETTAQLLYWALFELSRHLDWKRKLCQEQAQVLSKLSLEVNHLGQFTQLGHVLKEAERLYPPIYSIPRGVIQDFEYAGYLIPKGWLVVISPLLTHRLEILYPNPDRFDPDRFAPTREEDKKYPFALIGFGGGAHKCLGYELAQMKMKVILSTLLRYYNWEIILPTSSQKMFVHQSHKLQKVMKVLVKPLTALS